MRRLAIVVILILGSLSGTPEVANAQRPSLCVSGSSAAESIMSTSEMVNAVLGPCRQGDTIYLPTNAVGAIAQLCDFSRSIVTTSSYVICVLGPARDVRR